MTFKAKARTFNNCNCVQKVHKRKKIKPANYKVHKHTHTDLSMSSLTQCSTQQQLSLPLYLHCPLQVHGHQGRKICILGSYYAFLIASISNYASIYTPLPLFICPPNSSFSLLALSYSNEFSMFTIHCHGSFSVVFLRAAWIPMFSKPKSASIVTAMSDTVFCEHVYSSQWCPQCCSRCMLIY